MRPLVRGVDLPAYRRAVRALARDADEVVAAMKLRKGQSTMNVHAHALPAYEAFLERYYADAHPPVAAIAMNPGKFGAVQTGIPFTDWPRGLELLPDLDKLVDRSVGLPNPNREQSGRRVYGWGLQRFGSYQELFRHVLFMLTCPVAVLEGQGTRVNNVPLDQLPRREAQRCLDLIVRRVPALLKAAQPKGMLLLGAYAEGVWSALQAEGQAPAIPAVKGLHPAAHMPDPAWIERTDATWLELSRQVGARA
jgi:hypothetical protein